MNQGMKTTFAGVAVAMSLLATTPTQGGPYRESVEAYQQKAQEQYVFLALDSASQLEDKAFKAFAVQVAGSCFAGRYITEDVFRKSIRKHGLEAAKAVLDDRELMDYLDYQYPRYQYSIGNLHRLNSVGWAELCKIAFTSQQKQ